MSSRAPSAPSTEPARPRTAPPPPRGLAARPLPEGREGLPLLIEPAGTAAVAQALREDPAWAQAALLAHGALLFRGFPIHGPADFEAVARAIEPALANDYLGTSPRDALTPYVFSASELPPHYPIPQHIEMSFVARPPRRLFFCCLVAPSGPGGETPLCDFRAVLRDLDPAVRARFIERGVTNVRNYDGPGSPVGRDRWKLKRWDEMFRTTDHAVVEKVARENGFEVRWKPGDRLALVNTQPALRVHPETGEQVWFNHAQVFHGSSAAGEYRRVARRQGLRYLGLSIFAAGLMALQRRRVAFEEQAMGCSYGDGTPIPDGDMEAVRDAIWRNLVFPRWQRGDVVAIDNAAVAHGRMPYRGPRQVVVAWA